MPTLDVAIRIGPRMRYLSPMYAHTNIKMPAAPYGGAVRSCDKPTSKPIVSFKIMGRK